MLRTPDNKINKNSEGDVDSRIFNSAEMRNISIKNNIQITVAISNATELFHKTTNYKKVLRRRGISIINYFEPFTQTFTPQGTILNPQFL